MISDVALADTLPVLQLSRSADEYVGGRSLNSYAEKMLRNLSNISTGKTRQAAHFTFGQVVTTMPVEFGFQMGTPSIRHVWTRDDALPEWVAHIQQLCAHGSEDVALKEIALTTSRFKANGRLAQLSENLALFQLKRLPDVVLVSLLRNTFSIRSHVAYWCSLLEQTEQILRERKREPRLLLRGLKR
jgi:hypothetical protein